MKRTVLSVLLLMSVSTENSVAQPSRTTPPRMLFRHYALSMCLARAFPAIAKQADASANGYFELGSGTPEVYRAAQLLADEFLKRPYASQTGADLGVMKCIDFAESPQLARLIAHSIPEHGL